MTARKHALHAILVVLVMAALLAGVAVASRSLPIGSLTGDDQSTPSAEKPGVPAQRVVPPIPLPPEPDLDKPLNILLLGADSRTNSDPGRADAIILVRVEPATGHVRLLSLPRDTRVTIPGHGENKLNQASGGYYKDGGTDLLVRTIETSLLPGLHIDYTVKTDFAGFAAIVDALGGVTIDVEERMYYKAADVLIDLKPGVQHLDGVHALEYARFRMDAVGDFGTWSGQDHGRVARQKKLLSAIFVQNEGLRTLLFLPPVLKAVRAAVTTDVPYNVMERIAMAYRDITAKDVELVPFTGVPQYVDGVSYVIPNMDKLRSIVGPLFGVPAPGAN
jgi:LCP family protein required for cell wall assembly